MSRDLHRRVLTRHRSSWDAHGLPAPDRIAEDPDEIVVSRRVAFKVAREHGWPSIAAAEALAITQPQADALVTVDADLAALAPVSCPSHRGRRCSPRPAASF